MSRDRARRAIMTELLGFPTINQKHWDTAGNPTPGDLVSLCSAPSSKWYASWLVEVDQNGYLLESLEDEALCWWSNVGINIYSRERVSERPSWKWCDKQFAFNDRWNRVGKRNDAYTVLPCPPKFLDGGAVRLDVRIRFGLNDFRYPKTFPSWKKLLSRDMGAYYKLCCAEYENQKPAELPAVS